jgi:cytochrome P450
MIIGGMDTTTIALKWALSELIHHLEIMKKTQEELYKVVGRNRLVLQ